MHRRSVVAEQRGPATVLFTHYGDDWIRGSERCLLDLLTHLSRERFHPIVWCNSAELADAVRAMDVTVYEDDFSLLFDWQPPRYEFARYWEQIRTAARLIEAHNVRLLHANSVAPTQWLFPAARNARIPLLTHVHVPYERRERFTLAMHQATLAVGVSDGCVSGLKDDGFPVERIRTIYNAVDLRTSNDTELSSLRERLGIATSDIVLTQIGSLIFRKGQDLLLKAFANLVRQRPQCRLLLVGDGPERSAIEQSIRDLGLEQSVFLTGFVNNAASVFRFATDIAVSPSRAEGFGLSIIEAGATGCPVVATNTTGVSEIIEHGVSGLIVPVEDVDALAAALLHFVDNPEARKDCAAALRAVVEERFLVDRYVQEFETTYTDLLKIPAGQLGWLGSLWSGEVSMYAKWLSSVVVRRTARLFHRAPREAASSSE